MNFIPFSILGFGFLLGIKHAFDADHIAAVSTIASRQKSIKESSVLGLFWGFGHTISLLIVGILVLLFHMNLSEKIAAYFEMIVGLMMFFLGFNVLITMQKNRIHFHKHRHGKNEHIHFHSHKSAESHNHNHRSLFIGLVHGLAGSAAFALFALAAVKSVLLGLVYILIFGVGSIAGMVLICGTITFAFNFNKLEIMQKILKAGTGLSSAIIGLYILLK